MDAFRRFACPFWAAALLLLGCLSVLHGTLDSAGTDCVAVCTTGDLPDHSEPSKHHCCHASSPGSLPAANCFAPPRTSLFSDVPHLADVSAPDAPFREIDYPPQLS